MRLKAIIRGLISYIPKANKFIAKGTGGTNSARYCYSVWLRHLILLHKSGQTIHPKKIAELGPGDSIGIGLAGLISGCEQYFAFDVVEYANIERNHGIFEELVNLFKKREPIPGDDEFPEVKPKLKDYSFPSHILSDAKLDIALNESRINRIRSSISNSQQYDSVISYQAPWCDANILKNSSIDLIYSQAVLEHVDDLKLTYDAMYLWLKPTGCISHTIDFKSHGTNHEWNGHWLYSKFVWKLIRGTRPYLINREPCTTHINLITDAGFKVICDIRTTSTSKYKTNQLALEFRSISEDDLITSGIFIQAVKDA